jgi:hypothetical protein
MSKSAKPSIPNIKVEDADAAFRKFEDFGRKVLAVPKKEIDAKLAREKAAKIKRKG